MPRLHYVLSLIAAVFLGLLYGFQNFYPEFMYVFSNAFPPFIAGATVAIAYISVSKYVRNLKLTFSIIWLCFALGVTLWFLGELSWAIYTLILGFEIPYPSIGDAFWLSGYVPIFTALIFYVRNFWTALTKKIVGVCAVPIIILATVVSAYFISHDIAAQLELTILIIDVAYPLLDLILLFLAVLGFIIFFKGTIGKYWLLLSLALIFFSIADLLFSYTTLQGIYFNGHPLELFFHCGYLLYSLAFYVHIKEL